MKINKEEIEIRNRLLKKHIPAETRILTREQREILNKIEGYIKCAYNNSNFDLGIEERLIINLCNETLFISDNKNINYSFDKSNPCVIPIIKFLLDKGFCNNTYASLHGFKYMYRLLGALDNLSELD